MNKNLVVKTRQDLEKLRKRILKGAKIKKGTAADNVKLGSMGSWQCYSVVVIGIYQSLM